MILDNVLNKDKKTQFTRANAEATVVTITPELAKEMLLTSPGNRRLRQWYVSMLAGAMKRGEWRVTSQGIGFDRNGQLVDAHHRLNACIVANIPFKSVVVFGLERAAYAVIDTGINRTYGDRMNEPSAVADVLRLAGAYFCGTNKPTVDQIRPIADAGLRDAVQALTDYCGTRTRFYSTAPVKLAACITIMNGGDIGYVLDQYRALCTLNFRDMSSASQSLVRNVESRKAVAINTRETIARALRTFDVTRRNLTKIQIRPTDSENAIELVRVVLRRSVDQMNSHTEK